MVGSPFWMSPEMIKHEPYSYSTDIWGFGTTMLELANRTPPNATNIVRAMFVTGSQGCPEPFLYPKHWSADCKNFILAALQYEAAKRPTADEHLQHPFLMRMCNQKHLKKIISSTFLDNTFDALNIT